MVRLTKSMRKANRRAMEEMGFLYTLLSETLTNIQTVKAFGMERHERHRYHASGKKFYHRSMRIIFFNALARASASSWGWRSSRWRSASVPYLVLHPQATAAGHRHHG